MRSLIYKALFIFGILSPVATFAQQFLLSGTINDEFNQPIAYSNIVLLTQKDSVVTGTSTDEKGHFLLQNITKGEYILQSSFIGFETHRLNLQINADIVLDTIILMEDAQELEGVTVIAKRPTVKRMVDRLVFNIENSTLSEDNVLDVLKQTPGVLVFDNAITIKNATPTVYINDRKVHLSSDEVQQLLEGTSASNVKSIEVITNPPAKYEAEGGAVINIITSKNIISGYNGSVFGNYKLGSEFPKYAIGTSHFFKTDKLNVYLNYNISPRKDYRRINEFINFIDNSQITSSWESDYRRTRKSSNQNINGNIDFNINDNNSIGFSTNILISPKNNTTQQAASVTEVFAVNGNLDSLFISQNSLKNKRTNLAFTLDYIHKFKKEGEKLSMSIHHTNYDFLSDQNVATDYFLPSNTLIRNNRFQTMSGQKIKLYTGQIDYELPINTSTQFESGAKISSIDSESKLTQFNFENAQPVLDLQASDTFLYDEVNYAAYTSYSKDWEDWSFKAGIRVEYTDTKGNSLTTNQINNNDYLKVFPSFYLLNKLNDKNEIYLSYNKRIYRPRYGELNPFRYFLNDNTYMQGDPNLKPELDDQVTLGYTLNKSYTFELYYRYENNPTQEITFQDNDNNELKRLFINIDKNISYGIDFTAYTRIKPRWNLYVLSSLFYYEGTFLAIESNNELLSNDSWSIYAQVINYFTFLKDKSLTADISYLYISPVVDGSTDISQRSGLDINFKKTFWNNRASLSIGVSDIFNNQNFNQTTKYLNQDVFLKSNMENRLFTFGFNYKFGNYRLDSNKKEIDLYERDRLKERN